VKLVDRESRAPGAPQLLFITRKYPPSIGGMQQYCADLFTDLSATCNVSCVAWGGSQIALPLFMLYALIRSTVFVLRNPHATILLGDSILAPLALWYKLFGFTRCYVIVYGLDVALNFSWYRRAICYAIRRVAGVFAISRYTKQLVVELGVSPENVRICPPRVPAGLIPLDRQRARRVLAARHPALVEVYNADYSLLIMGRLVKRKGVAWFVREVIPTLVTRVPTLSLVIVGEGGEYNTIQRAIRELNLEDRIVMLGQIGDAEKDLVYSASDVFVIPNIPVPHNPEGFGIVALEAAQMNRWAIASALEGLLDAVVHDKTGTLLPPLDRDAFVEALYHHYKEPRSFEDEFLKLYLAIEEKRALAFSSLNSPRFTSYQKQ
jgi:phosphatidylinositol alpha-1,6-mannosyltransferase